MKLIFKIKEKIKAIHNLLPDKAKRLYFPFTWFYIKLRAAFHILCPQIIVTRGYCPGSAHPLSIIFINILLPELTYWSRKVLGPDIQKINAGRIWFWAISKAVKNKLFPCDLAIVEDKFLEKKIFPGKKYFNVPYMVEMELDISRSLEELCRQREKSGFVNVARRIRKYKLSYEVSHDPEAFRHFYYKMYLPLLQNRYGEESIRESYEDLKVIFLKEGELIFVTQGGERLAGTLIQYIGSHILTRVAGVENGDYEYIKRGVIGALYYYAIYLAQEKGYKKLNIGGTRPNLADGLTKYKIAFRSEINYPFLVIDEKILLQFIPLRSSEGLKRFFVNNHFIYCPKKKMPYRALFVDADNPDARKGFKEILQATNCGGISGTNVFVMSKSGTIPDWVAKESAGISGEIINFSV